MTLTLTIPVNGVYFDQIKAGLKTEEYRLRTPFWAKRLEGRSYSHVILTRGYPKADDHTRRLVIPWRGLSIKTIVHPHFGPDPVQVFAIDVSASPKTNPFQPPTRKGRSMGSHHALDKLPLKECGTPDTVYGAEVSHQYARFDMTFPVPLIKDAERAEFIAEMHAAMLPVVERLYERRWKQMFAGKLDAEGRLYPDEYQQLWPSTPNTEVSR